ncbi:hypothetical protein [Ammoniphilus sp. 3BR4]|uniref:hypothetical protein n=1 Tax=Ammoniphilus sp. 3BR4 TaxID=3158265 RepID=UPI003466DC98
MVSFITQVPKGFFKGKRLDLGQKKFLFMAYKDFTLLGAKGYDMGEEGRMTFLFDQFIETGTFPAPTVAFMAFDRDQDLINIHDLIVFLSLCYTADRLDSPLMKIKVDHIATLTGLSKTKVKQSLQRLLDSWLSLLVQKDIHHFEIPLLKKEIIDSFEKDLKNHQEGTIEDGYRIPRTLVENYKSMGFSFF